ncbi:NAD(P)-binding protein [Mytilinidion resinicola]|uniref:NAD(P)-binding protein n=1 Tax=Mytilinidion resinicola TaxID=574789 RepID=A0A6A6YPT8_9PEZI|nr:NAD(P)-binding protein [Mytilinidion resinicola]KAF2810569.1 NAD(P)-binding protein [Mytilinidion resinicola]
MGSTISQIFPPKPKFTEKNLPSLEGNVYIVTGSNTGVGKELAQMLYLKNAKVYIAARSQEKAEAAIKDIKKAAPNSEGLLVFLHLDLNDLTTIKASVDEFLAAETRLHVLFNNAGIMSPAADSPKTAQGYEIHLGVNCVGTFLFTKLLTPILVASAKTEAPGIVRVVWVSSSGTEIAGVKSLGLNLDNLDYHIPAEGMIKYALSKAGNWLHGVEFAKRYQADGVVSIPLNPGNLASDLYRQHGRLFSIFVAMITYPPINGAWTELYAGLSPEITLANSGSWVVPWGRILPIRKDLVAATKSEAEGGNGNAAKFWDWTEEQIKPYLSSQK